MPPKGKFILKKVADTTNNNTKGIITFLLEKGHSASRINTQGQFIAVSSEHYAYHLIGGILKTLAKYGLIAGSWRRSGSREGYYDISVCLKCKSGIGVFHVIDMKREGDRLREGQKDFRAEVEAAGGIATETESLAAYKKYYNEFLLSEIIEKL